MQLARYITLFAIAQEMTKLLASVYCTYAFMSECGGSGFGVTTRGTVFEKQCILHVRLDSNAAGSCSKQCNDCNGKRVAHPVLRLPHVHRWASKSGVCSAGPQTYFRQGKAAYVWCM